MIPNAGPAALVMRARRKVIDHLTNIGATSANSARTVIPTRRMEKNALTYLQRKGVVSLADGGRYWVDQAKADELRRANRTRMALILGGAVATVAAVFAMTR